jgi:hypothetical protein
MEVFGVGLPHLRAYVVTQHRTHVSMELRSAGRPGAVRMPASRRLLDYRHPTSAEAV